MKRIVNIALLILLPCFVNGKDSLVNIISVEKVPNEFTIKIDSEEKTEKSIWDSNLTGILISFLIALIVGVLTFLISKRQVQIEGNKLKIENDKLRTEIKAFHSEKILEQRINTFPKLFEILSLFTKKKFVGKVPKNELEELLENSNNWHAKNAIFFSPYTAYAYVQMRDALNIIIADGEQPETRKELKKYIDKLKIALCTDIGIYAAEFGLSKKRFEDFEAIGKYAIAFEEGRVKYSTQQ